jgi:hypothetical protein
MRRSAAPIAGEPWREPECEAGVPCDYECGLFQPESSAPVPLRLPSESRSNNLGQRNAPPGGDRSQACSYLGQISHYVFQCCAPLSRNLFEGRLAGVIHH